MTFTSEDFLSETNVPRETLLHLDAYAELLAKWQPSKNLISNSTLDDMWLRHFYDSAQLLPLIRSIHGDKPLRCLDIGSGAGFPGLVLAIMGIGDVTMVESNGKKCAFMRQVKIATKVDVTIENARIESLIAPKMDILLSRACASVLQLLSWGEVFIDENTEFWLLKGANVGHELKAAKADWTMQVDQYKSESDKSGIIVRLSNITRLKNP
jgi:16S rRNA (guanine527-N7)-methyltransferase